MPFKHGSKAIMKLTDGIPGQMSLRDVSIYTNNTGLTGPIDTAEVTTLGSFAKKYVSGLMDHTFPMEGPWSEISDEWIFSLIGASGFTEFQYAPGGSVSGYPVFSGSAMVTSYEITTEVGDAAKMTAAFQVSGSTARATIA